METTKCFSQAPGDGFKQMSQDGSAVFNIAALRSVIVYLKMKSCTTQDSGGRGDLIRISGRALIILRF